VDHPLPWLRYIDADDVDDQTIDFDGLKVRNPQMEKLGDVDGFIVDSNSGRPYYVVVDAGGWFKSRHFLLPIGEVRLDDDQDALVTNLSKERVHRFPGFDKDEFAKLSEDDLRRMNDEICTVCSVTAVSYSATEPVQSAWNRPQFASPTWWNTNPTNPDRMGDRAYESGVEYPPSATATSAAPASGSAAGRAQEQVRARERDDKADRSKDDRTGDVSPHFDGRAQPGDVLGLETGGERTSIGETSEDENKRRRDAEKTAKK
jgi:PRC-barrel domain protein